MTGKGVAVMAQLVFVLIDGLSAVCTQHMTYMAAHAQRGALCGIMDCALPTLSRPIYATLFTGVEPLENGIVSNTFKALPEEQAKNNFFAHMHATSRTCAAAAYYWMYELYHGAPFDPLQHRWLNEPTSPLPYGMFYTNDAYPDDHVFYDAALLEKQYSPDFLLIHTMGVDNAGHKYGFDSPAYRNAVRHIDMLLAHFVPTWCASGSTVIVTADHGMHEDAAHNDLTPQVRSVPFWILQPQSMTHVPAHQKEWHSILRTYFP